jgi:hypothetical protein
MSAEDNMSHFFGGNDPTIPLEVMAFQAAIAAGEVKFISGHCLVPSCSEKDLGSDYDGGAYIYCEKHNSIMHLDYDVDISKVSGLDGNE